MALSAFRNAYSSSIRDRFFSPQRWTLLGVVWYSLASAAWRVVRKTRGFRCAALGSLQREGLLQTSHITGSVSAFDPQQTLAACGCRHPAHRRLVFPQTGIAELRRH